jgi:hypothetical protein
MNTKLIFNLARVIVAGAMIFSGLSIYINSQDDSDAIIQHFQLVIGAIYTVGGSLLAFLPYAKGK